MPGFDTGMGKKSNSKRPGILRRLAGQPKVQEAVAGLGAALLVALADVLEEYWRTRRDEAARDEDDG